MILTKNFLRKRIVDPLPSKQNMGGSNPYGGELIGNLTATVGGASSASGGGAVGAGAAGAVGENVILDKSASPDALQKSKDAIAFLYNEIQALKAEISGKRSNGEDISTDMIKLTEKCQKLTGKQLKQTQMESVINFAEGTPFRERVMIIDGYSSIREDVRCIDQAYDEILETGDISDWKLNDALGSIQRIGETVTGEPDLESSSLYDIFLGEFAESVGSDIEEVRGYIMDKNDYRVQQAFSIYENVYRDDKRIRFTPKQNLEFRKMAMERRNEVELLLNAQNNDIRICTTYCEGARSSGDFVLLGEVMDTLKTMESARDVIIDIYSALSFSKIQEATADQVEYLRENALTIKFKTIRDLLKARSNDPTAAELMKNKEWNSTYKKWCELQNQQDELIREREKLYSINNKKPSKSITDAIARINSKLATVLKQISALDDKITDIETQLMKQNCMSKSYWKRRIEQCQSAIDINEKKIAEKEKHIEFVEKMLGNEKVQSNADAVRAIKLEKDALELEIDLLKKSINKGKMAIVKWKGIVKNAPEKTAVRDGKVDVSQQTPSKKVRRLNDKVTRLDDKFEELQKKAQQPGATERDDAKAEKAWDKYCDAREELDEAMRRDKQFAEAVTIGERLDKLVDNFVNRQLRADDDFKELDDKLWKEKAELNSLNRKAARLTESDDDYSKVASQISAKEKGIKELQDKWERRLEELAPYLPYSYWKKLSDRYTKQIVWNTDMAESFADSVKDAQETLASIESGWTQGSAALMRANIKFYQDRADHYKQEAKSLMRLQKDAEERMKKAPNPDKK